MIRRMPILTIAVICLLPVAGPLVAEVPASVDDIVRCTEVAFSRSVETRNKDAFRQFLDPDTRFIGGDVLRGPAEVIAAWSVFLDNDYPRIVWRPAIIEVLNDGTLALSRGPYLMTSVDDDGNELESWGTFTSIWRLHDDGNWRIIFDAGSDGSGPVPDDHRARLAASVTGC